MEINTLHHKLTLCINMIMQNKIKGFKFIPSYDKDNPSKIKSGVITIGDKRYFFKFFYNNFFKSDFLRLQNFALLFSTPQILDLIVWKNKIKILVYEHIQAKEINGFAYIGYKDDIYKKDKISKFFDRLSCIYLKNLEVSRRKENYPSAIFFEERLFKGKAVQLYQNNYLLLLHDILKLVPNLFDDISNSIKQVTKYFKSTSMTLITLSHGDLHDFNYSYDWVFWDLDQCGRNPILCDVSICFWSLISQRFLLMKYNKKFINDNSNLNGPINSSDVKLAFDAFFHKMFLPIVSTCSEYFNWREEFISRMFCRFFLVSNVLNYTKNDRIFIYKMWFWLVEWYKFGKPVETLKEMPTFINY